MGSIPQFGMMPVEIKGLVAAKPLEIQGPVEQGAVIFRVTHEDHPADGICQIAYSPLYILVDFATPVNPPKRRGKGQGD